MGYPCRMGETVQMKRPPRQVCPFCGHDEEVTWEEAKGVFACTTHGEWEPSLSADDGLMESWGVFDDLRAVLTDRFASNGKICASYAERNPSVWNRLVAMYPTDYTAETFIGQALGHMWRRGTITYRPLGRATFEWALAAK